MDLKSKVLQFIQEKRLIKPGATLIVGVSGGPDSVVLLYLLNELRHSLSVTLHVAHFNHRLRPTSDRDAKFVLGLARQMNLPCTVGRRNGTLKASLSEDQARKLRFDFFTKLTIKTKATAVVLAHTQNDVAETVLLRLLRGSGLCGLRGILPQRQINGTMIVRPLVELSRREIEVFIKRNKLEFCTDETNLETYYLRNKVRLKLLPFLAKDFNPNVTGVLADLAQTAGDDYDFLQQQLVQRIKKNVVSFQGKVRISIAPLSKEHPSMQRLLLRYAFEQLSKASKDLSFVHIQDVEALIKERHVGAIVHWPQKIKVVKLKKHIELTR